LSTEEISYTGQVYKNFVALGLENMNTLKKLISDGDTKMTDGERIRQIEVLEGTIKDESRAVQVFIAKTDWVITQRQREYHYTEKIKNLYGLP
jgi:hypothetical protein